MTNNTLLWNVCRSMLASSWMATAAGPEREGYLAQLDIVPEQKTYAVCYGQR